MHEKLKKLYPFDYHISLFRIKLNQDKVLYYRNEYAKTLNSRSIESFIEFNNLFIPHVKTNKNRLVIQHNS